MKKLMLIVNPVAGKGKFKNSLGEVLHTFYQGGYLPEIYFTSAKGDATNLAIEHAKKYDIIACMGGDGTLSEVTAGICQIKDSPPIGYIPMGTSNDVASGLGISKNPITAAKSIIEGKAISLDIGKMNDSKYFTYIAAFGMFTDVSYQTPRESKQVLGQFAYILEGIARVPKLPTIRARVIHDGGLIEDDFIFAGVTNSTKLAGLFQIDEAVVGLSDGLFEVVLVKRPKTAKELQDAFRAYIAKDYAGDIIKIVHSRSVRFRFDEPVAWTTDGENGGEHVDVYLENINSSVKIIVDSEK